MGVLILVAWGSAVQAQRAYETFGRNRVQYKDFEWKYLSSENFDVYFYGDRRKLAQEALQYMESEFDRITDLLGFYPYQKTKVFLYNSIADLQQSNVGLNQNRFNVSGETTFVKPYVEIAHPGNLDDFKRELLFKMSNLLVNEMMFGGSLREMFASSVLLNLPDWFIDGTSYYVAYGWNEEMDDYVRQLVKSKNVSKALRLKDKEAALVGQSIWNFIVEKYGKSSINNILNYTRIIRNEEKSILITLGVPFKQLVNDWRDYYTTMEKKVEQSYVPLADSNKFTNQKRRLVTYTTVKVSPDGKSVAYAVNDRGRFTVKVKSLENGSETVILSGGNRVIKQTVDYRVPLLSWSDATTLGVIGVKNGQYIFWLYDLRSKTKLPRELDKFSNIRSFNFSSNGRLVIVSADFEGQNDLFLLSSRRDRTKRLTNDSYDDLDPAFIPNSNTIVFSSNRVTDSLTTDAKALQKLSPYYNLFMFNIDTTTNRLKRVTNTLSKDFHVRAPDDHNFYYLSDQRGIVNLFRFNLQTGTYAQVTNFNSSIKDFDINFDHRILATVITQKLRENIFVNHDLNLDRQVFTPPTRRKEVQLARIVTDRRKKEPAKKPATLKDLINARLKESDTTRTKPTKKPPVVKPDSTVHQKAPGQINTDNYSFDEPTPTKPPQTVAPPDTTKKVKPVAADKTLNTDNYTFEEESSAPKKQPANPSVQPNVQPKVLNTENYVFEEDAVRKKEQPNETFLTRYMKAREVSKVKGPFPYEPKFSYDNLITNPVVIDQLRGWSVRLETQMNDMLENYRFTGGLQVALSDLKSGDVFGEFQYLPHRVDFSTRFDRKVIYWVTQNPENASTNVSENQKYSFQKFELGASYPLSIRTRVSVKPFVGYTEFVDRGFTANSGFSPTFYPTQHQVYTGAKVEAVFDNSITTGLNIIEGTRGKLSAINYQAAGNAKKNFSQVYVDVRHYQKIYKEIVFAVRTYAGSFLGRAPKKYLLGGMDNWAFNTTNYNGTQNPLVNAYNTYNENLLFAEFATGLRGFDYATQYGNSVAMANAEFRIPLVRALATGPIASNFFRNLQFTGFYDVGSSWTGAIPFGSSNVGRTRDVTSGAFSAQIKEYLNPWLYSYGFGFRSMIFGYYIKADLAWPVVNYTVQNPRAQLSFGFDF